MSFHFSAQRESLTIPRKWIVLNFAALREGQFNKIKRKNSCPFS